MAWRAVQALAEAGMAALLLWLAFRWGLLQSLKIRLLAMLHVGFVWLGLVFALAALSHGLMAATDGARSLGLAPVHALAAGFFGSTLLAMATRVSAGHAGRALHASGGVVLVLAAAVGGGRSRGCRLLGRRRGQPAADCGARLGGCYRGLGLVPCALVGPLAGRRARRVNLSERRIFPTTRPSHAKRQ